MHPSLPVFYFALGLQLQLPRLAASLYLLQDLHMEVARLAAFEATLAIPWCLKPVFGFVSDAFPWCGGLRRAPYIVAGNALLVVVWTALARAVEPTAATVQGLMVLASTATCMVDVMYDSLLVEVAQLERPDQHGTRQAHCWAARATGSLAAALGGGVLLQVVTPRTVFALVACLSVGIGVFATGTVCHDERPPDTSAGRPTWRGRVAAVVRAFRHPALWRPALFVFVFAATPSSGDALFAFLVRDLHFSPGTLGVLGFVQHGAMLVGTVLFQRYWRFAPYRRFFAVIVVLSAVLGATPVVLVTHWNQRYLGIPNTFFAAGDDLFLSVLGQVALMPCLVLAAKLCPPGIEASLYATFVSVLNFAGVVSEYGGGLLTSAFGVTRDDFTHLVPLVLTCTASTLLALAALPLLPRGTVRDVERATATRSAVV